MSHDDTTYMVWYDKDKKVKQATKLKKAVQYYTEKYGIPPKEVVVHESDIEIPSDVSLRTARFVHENYFYFPLPDKRKE